MTTRRKPKTKRTSPPASAKHQRETRLLIELRDKHGYGWIRFPREADRYTYAMNLTTGAGSTKYVLKCIVPLDSALGETLQNNDKRRDAQAKRDKTRAKTLAAKRRAARPKFEPTTPKRKAGR